MKAHITIDYFKNDYGYSNINDQTAATKDTEIQFFIDRATTYIDKNIIGGAVSQGIRDNFYTLAADGEITITDPIEAKDLLEQEKIEAYREAIATFTKFGLDTGYDFITGSFSRGMGSENYAEVLDYENSLKTLTETIRASLAIYSWTVTITSGSINIAYDTEDEPVAPGAGEVPGEDRYITTRQLTVFHNAGHVEGGGIVIEQTDEAGVVKFSVDPNILEGNLSVEDTEIIATQNHIANTELAYDDDLATEPGGIA